MSLPPAFVTLSDSASAPSSCFITWGNRAPSAMPIAKLATLGRRIVTVDIGQLSSECRSAQCSLPADIVDVHLAAGLISGGPVGRYGKHAPHTPYNRLLDAVDWDGMAGERYPVKSELATKSPESVASRLKSLKALWHALEPALSQAGEADRYWSVELPASMLLAKQIQRGVRVNQAAVSKHLEEATISRDAARARLRLDHGIVHLSSKSIIKRALVDASQLRAARCFGTRNVIRELRRVSRDSPLAKDLLAWQTSSLSRDILLEIRGWGDTVFPHYESFGTVTGRTVVKRPALQNLKRRWRDVLIPSPGFSFLYPDFSQFEPSVLAYESEDQQLIKDVEKGVVYDICAKEALGNVTLRSEAKIVFNAFCNGMSVDRIVELGQSCSNIVAGKSRASAERWLRRYPRMLEWKLEIENELLSTGRVGTRLGNHRYRTSSGDSLSSSDARWAVNQRIQGTASLIVKMAMLSVAKSEATTFPVLPLHDGILYEVPAGDEGRHKDLIEKLFLEAFQRLYAGSRPMVKFKCPSDEDA